MQGSTSLLKRGRVINSGKFKGPTKVIRVPIERIEAVYQFLEEGPFTIPLYLSKVPAGFPSPGEDYIEDKIDLNKLLVKKQAATYMVKVSGDSMIEEGILPGDLLIVDRSLEAAHNDIILAEVNGEVTVKKLYMKNEVVKLLPANKAYKPIEIKERLEVWGVVSSSVRIYEKK